MGRLITSEFRKILTVNLWWALLIPAALFTFFLAWFGGAVGSFAGSAAEFGGDSVPIAGLMYAAGFNLATVFGAIFGGLSMSGELRHKTITTTFLTADSRAAVLGAKLVSCAAVGAFYGVVCAITGSLGAFVGYGDGFPAVGDWLLLCLVSIVLMVLWTLLGVGFGALVGNQVGVVLIIPIYTLLGETILVSLFSEMGGSAVSPYLPNGSGSFALLGLAMAQLFSVVSTHAGTADIPPEVRGDLEAAGVSGQFNDWWLSGLAFLGWAALFVLLGWLLNQKRDVT
ncbi:ABC transporter permease [Actinoalloteichus sp. AHMU CJ021]|uniref:ABC-type transport system involved in multi-copper enzyme maturation, permease component n=1 Tax=Actinoalloteichus caeruleus DSM 43889 TaxID=1120930 RepID=A0ABT1JMM6_ACTCY|nr:ABC transporter permease [Actinoalloteichus caeruleus]AUS79684.1 ABC transporter permease [Actinoalloteichus sp. AHMU CJ021]MCP2333771.1 ABC-type transport system involved in multi-copper enzyme maturation, permease component [Actinoalloteichus caeruleus DSM 43889]